MKTVICPYNKPYEWVQEFFPGLSLCALPLAGKIYAGHLLNLSFMLKASEALVLDYDFVAGFHQHLDSNKDLFGLSVQYLGSEVLNDPAELYHKHSSFIGGDSCLIFFGPVLPDITDIDELQSNLVPATEFSADGVYLLKDKCFYRCEVPLRRIDTLKNFYELNFALLANPGLYVLPGYSAEKGVHFGENVELMTDMLQPPLMFSDHCSINRNCVLKDAIIGRNVIVDAGTEIYRSILFNNVFVGGHMELNRKIVYLNRIIDPDNGVFIQAEKELALGIKPEDAPLHLRLLSRLMAFGLGVLLLPLFILLLPLKMLKPNALYLYKLSFDRYTLYWCAAFGSADLIHEPGHENCFIFRASDADSTSSDADQQKLDDLYYQHYRSPRMMARIVLKGLVNRMFEKYVR